MLAPEKKTIKLDILGERGDETFRRKLEGACFMYNSILT